MESAPVTTESTHEGAALRTRSVSFSRGDSSSGPTHRTIPTASKHGAISAHAVLDYFKRCLETPYSPVASPSLSKLSRAASPNNALTETVSGPSHVEPEAVEPQRTLLPRRGSFVGSRGSEPPSPSPNPAQLEHMRDEHYRGELKVAMEEFASASYSTWAMLADYKGAESALLDFCRNEDIQTRTTLSATQIREMAFHCHEHHDRAMTRDEFEVSTLLSGPQGMTTDPFTVDYTYLLDGRATEIVGDLSNVHRPLGKDPGADQKDSRFQVMSDNSAVDTTELVYVRVWNSRREGRKFQQALRALSQSRQDLMLPAVFSVPHSVALAYQGKYVTVTWLVPIMDEFPMVVGDDSLVKAAEECWKAGLGIASTNETIPMYIGADGRYYVFGGPEVLASLHSPKFPGSCNTERTELSAADAFQERSEKKLPAEVNTQHIQKALFDRVLHAVRRWLKDGDSFPESDPELFSRLMKNAGLNMQYLYEVRAFVSAHFNMDGQVVGSSYDLKSMQGQPPNSEGSLRQLSVHCHNATKVQFLALLDEELACRSVLSIVEAAVGVAAQSMTSLSQRTSRLSSRTEGQESDEEEEERPDRKAVERTIVEAANKVLGEITSNPDYMRVDVMHILRLKFNAPLSFTLKTSDINLNNVWYFVADRLGLAYDDKEKLFVGIEEPMPLGHSGRRQILSKFEVEDRVEHKDAADTRLITKRFLQPQRSMLTWVKHLKDMDDSAPPTLRNVAALYAVSSCMQAIMEYTFQGAVEPLMPIKGADGIGPHDGLWKCFRWFVGEVASARRIYPSATTVGKMVSGIDYRGGACISMLLAVLGEVAPHEHQLARAEMYVLSHLRSMSAYDVAYFGSRANYLANYFTLSHGSLGELSRARLLKCWAGAIDIGHEVFELDPLWHVRQTAGNFSLFATQPTHVNQIVLNLRYIEVRRDIVLALVITAGVDNPEKNLVRQGDSRISTGALEIAAILALVNFEDLLDEANQLSPPLRSRLSAMISRLSDSAVALSMALAVMVIKNLRLLPELGSKSSMASMSPSASFTPRTSDPFEGGIDLAANSTSSRNRVETTPEVEMLLERVEELRFGFTKVEDAGVLNSELFTAGMEQARAIRDMIDHLKTGLPPQHEFAIDARCLATALSMFVSRVELAKHESIAHEEATGSPLPTSTIVNKVSALTLNTVDSHSWANVTIDITHDNDDPSKDDAQDLKTGFATREAISVERSMLLSVSGTNLPMAVVEVEPLSPRGRLAAVTNRAQDPFEPNLLQPVSASRTNSTVSKVRSVGWGSEATPFQSPFGNHSFGSPNHGNFSAFGAASDGDPFADASTSPGAHKMNSPFTHSDDVASRRSSVHSARRQSRAGSLAPKYADSAARIGPSSDAIFNYYSMKQVVNSSESKHAMREYMAACYGTWYMLSEYAGPTGAVQAFERNNAIQSRTNLSAVDVRNVALLKRNPDLFTSDFTSQIDQIAVEMVAAACANVFEGFSQERNEKLPDGEHRQVISNESFVDTEELVYVRVWNSRREGRKFQQALRALSQSRQDLMLPAVFSVPHSVALAYQGKYVTVTWLVPIMDEFPMQFDDTQTLVGAVEECWRVSMGVPLSASRIPLYIGADGRYYAAGVQEVLYHTLTPKFAGSSATQRTEFCALDIFKERYDRNLRTEINTQHIQNGLFDRVMHTLRGWLKDRDSFPESDPELFSRLMKNAGLNMQYLYEVRAFVQDNFNGLNRSLNSPTRSAKRGSITNLPRNADEMNICDAETKVQFLALIDEEMACRTVLSVVEGAIGLSANNAMDDIAVAVAAANDVLCELKDNTSYFRCDIMHVMRQKFNAPPTFILDISDVNLHNICFFVADRLGLSFDKNEEIFTGFEEPMPLSHSGRSVLCFEERHELTRPFIKPLHLSQRWLQYLESMEELDAPALRTVAAINALSALNEAGVWGEVTLEQYTQTVKEIADARLPDTKLDPLLTNTNIARRKKVRGIPTALTLAVLGETCPEDMSLANKELLLLSALPSMSYLDVAYTCDRLNYLQACFRQQGIPLTVNDRARIFKCWGGALALGHEVYEADPLWHVRQTAANFAFFSTLASNVNSIVTNLQFIDIRREITVSMVVCSGVDAVLEDPEVRSDSSSQGADFSPSSGRPLQNGDRGVVSLGCQQACAVMALVNFDDLLDAKGSLSGTIATRLIILIDYISQSAFSVAMGLAVLTAEKLCLLRSDEEEDALGVAGMEVTRDDGVVEELLTNKELHAVVENARFTYNTADDAQTLNDELYDIGDRYEASIRSLRDHLGTGFSPTHPNSEQASVLARALSTFVSRVQWQRAELQAAMNRGVVLSEARRAALALKIEPHAGDMPLTKSSTNSRSGTPSMSAPGEGFSISLTQDDDDDGEDLHIGFASREAVELERSYRCASSMGVVAQQQSGSSGTTQSGQASSMSLFLSISSQPPRSATPRVPGGRGGLPTRRHSGSDGSDALSLSYSSQSVSMPRRTVLTPTATGFTIEVGEVPSRSGSPEATSPAPEMVVAVNGTFDELVEPSPLIEIRPDSMHSMQSQLDTQPVMRVDTQSQLRNARNTPLTHSLLSPHLGAIPVETDDDTASRSSAPETPKAAPRTASPIDETMPPTTEPLVETTVDIAQLRAQSDAKEKADLDAMDEERRVAMRSDAMAAILEAQRAKEREWQDAVQAKIAVKEAIARAEQQARLDAFKAIDEAAADLKRSKGEVLRDETSARDIRLQEEIVARVAIEKAERQGLLEATVMESEGMARRAEESRKRKDADEARAQREGLLREALDKEEKEVMERLRRHRDKRHAEERSFVEADEMRERRAVVASEAIGEAALQERLDRITSRLRMKERLRGAGLRSKPPILQDLIDVLVRTNTAPLSEMSSTGIPLSYDQLEQDNLSKVACASRSDIENLQRYAFNAILDAFVIETRVILEGCDVVGMVFGTAASFASRVHRCEREEGVSRAMIEHREFRLRKEMAAIASGRDPLDVDRGITPHTSEAPAAILRPIPPPSVPRKWAFLELAGPAEQTVSPQPHTPHLATLQPVRPKVAPPLTRSATSGAQLRYSQRNVTDGERAATASLVSKLRGQDPGAGARPSSTPHVHAATGYNRTNVAAASDPQHSSRFPPI